MKIQFLSRANNRIKRFHFLWFMLIEGIHRFEMYLSESWRQYKGKFKFSKNFGTFQFYSWEHEQYFFDRLSLSRWWMTRVLWSIQLSYYAWIYESFISGLMINNLKTNSVFYQYRSKRQHWSTNRKMGVWIIPYGLFTLKKYMISTFAENETMVNALWVTKLKLAKIVNLNE